MPRSEVYQLRLTSKEKTDLAKLAREEGVSIARMIRRRFGLSSDPAPAHNVAKLPPPRPFDSVPTMEARQKAEVREATAQGEYEVKVEAGSALADAKQPSKAAQAVLAQVGKSSGADPKTEPGKAAIEELAQRLRIKTDSKETAEASLEPLVTQLKGQGMTTPVARREARKRLGL